MENEKPIYELEERTLHFAKRTRIWLKDLHRNLAIIEDSKQLVRSSGSVGANYIEANESLGKRILFIEFASAEKKQKKVLIGYDC